MSTGSRLSYADLERMPDDGLRREIIDGELYVTPSPVLRHQRVVLRIGIALDRYAQERGGEAFIAPLDVVFTPHDVAEPDVFYVGQHKTARLGSRHVEVPPDLVVEVSPPGLAGETSFSSADCTPGTGSVSTGSWIWMPTASRSMCSRTTTM